MCARPCVRALLLQFVIVRGAFSSERVRDLRETVEKLLDRAAAAEDAGEDGPLVPKVNWINREKRLHSRMGDYLMPSKFDPLYIEWLAEDCYDHLSQLIDGGEVHGVRHCRFQMLCAGDGQPYKQNWHRDWQVSGFLVRADTVIARWLAVRMTISHTHTPSTPSLPPRLCSDGRDGIRTTTEVKRERLEPTSSTSSGTARLLTMIIS